MRDTPLQLRDAWNVRLPFLTGLDSWLLCGDHIAGSAHRTTFCLDIYTGAPVSQPGGFGTRLTAPHGDVTLAYADGILYLTDGKNIRAMQLGLGGLPLPSWAPAPIANVTSLQAADGVVVVAAEGDRGETVLTGLAADTGKPLWGPVTTAQMSAGAPAVGDKATYFAAGGSLYAINVGSGNTRFTATPHGAVLEESRPPLVVGTTVICGGNAVYAFDYRTGKPVWTALGGSASGWRIALSSDRTLVIASGGDGRVCGLRVGDGTQAWHQAVDGPAEPIIQAPYVFVLGSGNTTLHEFHEDDGTGHRSYTLGDVVASDTPLVANGCLFVPTSDTHLHAMPFGEQQAAYFDGATSYIAVQSPKADFDFGLNDFALELWVRSSNGGDLVSASAPAGQCGWRFKLSPQGAVQFAVLDTDFTNADLWTTSPVGAADGEWHHLAAVRRDRELSLYVDGIARKTRRAYQRDGERVNPHYDGVEAPPLAISGCHTVTIGAWCPAGGAPQKGLRGLLREVRVWARAIDADAIQSRMWRSLNFLTADLVANWHLAHDFGAPGTGRSQPLVNDVNLRPFDATFVGAASVVTDFATDESDYPFLLEKEALPWPYDSTEHWASAGHDPISLGPVLDPTGVVCFGDGEALYAADKSRGSRQWTVDTPRGSSAPVALPAGGGFLALTREFGLITIDRTTGERQELAGFEELATGTDDTVALAAPAVSAQYTAAAGVDGALLIRARTADNTAAPVPTAPLPTAVCIAGDTIVVATPGSLHVVDAPTATAKHRFAADVDVFHVDDARIVCVQSGRVVGYDRSTDLSTAAFTAPPLAGTVTGMAPVPDGNLLVVTTDTGWVYGLSLATLLIKWTYALPQAQAPRRLFAPSVGDGIAAVTCVSGRLTLLDLANGELVGAIDEPRPLATPPVLDHGTVFYGCGEGSGGALDGALHSIVVGNTVALRLGLQSAGVRGYAHVDNPKPLQLRAFGEVTVETWVNTRRGGEIFTLLPEDDRRGFGIRWSLAADGTIAFEFSSRDDDTGAWSALTATSGKTAACEGQWHHLAVSVAGRVDGAWDVRVYVDGQLQPVTVESADPPGSPISGCHAFIGGGLPDATLVPTAFFEGLISEVRLWDNWLVAAEISDRMHTTLRGDEADLLAHWNFAAKTVHDVTRSGYDGTLVSENVDADFWLTDLPYAQPAYPFLQSAASIKEETATTRTYQLRLKAINADQTPDVAKLSLWYVRYEGSDEPATLNVVTLDGHTYTLAGVPPAHECDPGSGIDGLSTDAAGTLTLFITTSDVDHGPSLDVRADYMYPQERYHVSTLIDNQKLSRPAPPVLAFQTKLLQDFHYVPGDPVGAHSHRNTFRTVLSTRDADGSPRAGETVQVWAEEPLDIEVGSDRFHVNANNSQTFTTDHSGEVSLVIEAGDIRCPELLVWAGFMARTDRVKVPVDADVRSGLSTIDGPSMNETRPRQWRPDSEGGPVTATLLEGNYQSHAGDISQTMRHLATAGQPAGSTSAPMLTSRPPRLRARAPFPDMRPYDPVPMRDRAPVLRTIAHVNRRQPMTPEYMRESLRAVTGNPNAIGFSFTAKRDTAGNFTGLEFDVVTSHAQLTAIKSAAVVVPPVERRLGSIFDDIWDDVKDAAESVYDAAQQLVITVGNTVTAAINAAGQWIATTIHDIKDAFIAIGNFLKQIALDVLKVIEFLLSFFDFGEIIEVANRLRTYLADGLRQTATELRTLDLEACLPKLMTWFEAQAGVLASGTVPIESAAQARQGGDPGPAAASNSVDGKYAQSKLDEHAARSDFSVAADAAAALPGEFLELAEGLAKAIVDFLVAVPSLPSMSLDDFRALVARLMSDLLTPLFKIMETLLQAVFASLAELLDLAATTLDTEISIPFLSDLLKWLFPSLKVTYGLVATFTLAVPFQLIFRAASGRKFSEVAPAALPPLFSSNALFLAAADDNEWKKHAWASSALVMGLCQAVADAIRMMRADKMYPFGWTSQGPSRAVPPPLPEYLANLGIAAFGSLNAWTSRNPVRWIQITLQSVNGLKVLYNGYRSFNPAKGTFGLSDGVMPFLAMAAGIGTVAVGFSDANTSKAQAELWCWNIPQIYRPVTVFPIPPMARGLIILADVALFSAAAGIHWDSPAYA